MGHRLGNLGRHRRRPVRSATRAFPGSDSGVRAAGHAGLRPTGTASADGADDVVRAVQAQVIPLDRNYFRTGAALRRSLGVLDQLWRDTAGSLTGTGNGALAARQAAAMVAHARWMYRAALTREESRGLHRRDDHLASRPQWQRRILIDGLDEVRTEPPHRPSSPTGAHHQAADRHRLDEVAA